MADGKQELRQLLSRWGEGDAFARDRLMRLVYDRSWRLLDRCAGPGTRPRPVHASALVFDLLHEANERGRAGSRIGNGRFAGLVAQIVRSALTDYARDILGRRHGEHPLRLVVDTEPRLDPAPEVSEVERALHALHEENPRRERIAELRLFGGFEYDDIATMICMSAADVEREWNDAERRLLLLLDPRGFN
ncbi:MAG: hypothetical protein GY716_07510 [bacterium]|nr:hypothetical protein [bacterium]